MTEFFVTRNGRRVPEHATDQAGSEALIRTVSRYTDGQPIDRPQLCVALRSSFRDPRAIAEQLDRRGYLPPERPMTRAEFDRLDYSRRFRQVLWGVLGEGLPIGFALERYLPGRHTRNDRESVRRLIRQIGWAGPDGHDRPINR